MIFKKVRMCVNNKQRIKDAVWIKFIENCQNKQQQNDMIDNIDIMKGISVWAPTRSRGFLGHHHQQARRRFLETMTMYRQGKNSSKQRTTECNGAFERACRGPENHRKWRRGFEKHYLRLQMCRRWGATCKHGAKFGHKKRKPALVSWLLEFCDDAAAILADEGTLIVHNIKVYNRLS